MKKMLLHDLARAIALQATTIIAIPIAQAIIVAMAATIASTIVASIILLHFTSWHVL